MSGDRINPVDEYLKRQKAAFGTPDGDVLSPEEAAAEDEIAKQQRAKAERVAPVPAVPVAEQTPPAARPRPLPKLSQPTVDRLLASLKGLDKNDIN